MAAGTQNFPAPGDSSQGRAMIITRAGIVATSQPLASQAGAQMLASGGSAVDAAVAANAALGVVEPMSNGMGGDLFAIYWDANTRQATGLNASGWAPEKLTPELLHQTGHAAMPEDGIFSVTVPGCVRGWEALHKRFGRLPWPELFQPAIYYARNGFPVTERISREWALFHSKLAASQNGSRVYLINGETPEMGGVFRNPDYALALEMIASEGADAFYRGGIAQAILATSHQLGGVMTAADLADFQEEWAEPISTTYRDWSVYELPPNGQGLAALEMLNIMEAFPLSQWGFPDARAFHVKMEAQKLAYADLYRYNADPRFNRVPTAGIICKSYGWARAATIDMNRSRSDVSPGDPSRLMSDTIYMAAVDKDGNTASLIQSLYFPFGSGIVVDDFGIALQNRGALFVLDPAHPDILAGRKRPFHTIIPAFMQKGSVHIGFGIMGGLNQPQAHAQFVSNVVDYGMNIQSALEAPRFSNPTFGGCTFFIEDRVPEHVIQALVERGHKLDLCATFSDRMGGGQAVLYDSSTGVKYGASDPRKDGAAVPEPTPSVQSPGAGKNSVI